MSANVVSLRDCVTKRCTRCLETRPLDQFPPQGRGGVGPWCKTCRAEWSRDYYIRRGKLRRHLRDVSHPSPGAPTPPRGELVEVVTCVCGAFQAHHRNGEGACAATNCPEFFERGL